MARRILEYKLKSIKLSYLNKAEEVLNALLREGWEVVHFETRHTAQGKGLFLLKKEVGNKPAKKPKPKPESEDASS